MFQKTVCLVVFLFMVVFIFGQKPSSEKDLKVLKLNVEGWTNHTAKVNLEKYHKITINFKTIKSASNDKDFSTQSYIIPYLDTSLINQDSKYLYFSEKDIIVEGKVLEVSQDHFLIDMSSKQTDVTLYGKYIGRFENSSRIEFSPRFSSVFNNKEKVNFNDIDYFNIQNSTQHGFTQMGNVLMVMGTIATVLIAPLSGISKIEPYNTSMFLRVSLSGLGGIVTGWLIKTGNKGRQYRPNQIMN